MKLEPSVAAEPACWKVLLVDDEPTVHEMSRLILAGLAFEGRAVELISAGSAAQAREILSREHGIALTLLDVVMETDDAGIALVQHIRERLHDRDMQIVLRTGQPGVAPEGELMRRYEINGYFLKTEITAQRLHSIVISALRGYRHSRGLRGVADTGAPREPDALRLTLARELERLDEAQAVLMQAQPEVDLTGNQVSGIELVPQWRTASGLQTASRVADAMAHSAARTRIERWLLAQACFWARAWQVRVSIPVVGENLADCATQQVVVTAVRDAGLPPRALDLLVSESTLLSGHPDVRGAVDTLRAAGVSLTLVDFGAQTISLQRLNHVIPDRLKIHRLFVRSVAHEPERMALARSLIALAQTLRIVSIADGIATDADAQFFKWEGCDLGQGDALAPACAVADVAAFLQQGRRAAH